MILGIDEAGKGAVMGPLVVAGVMVNSNADLDGIKLNDSKKLGPSTRRRICRQIMGLSKCHIVTMDAEELDMERETRTINDIEFDIFSDVISHFFWKVKSGKTDNHLAIVDAVDSYMGEGLKNVWGSRVKILAEHHADSKWPVVMAASIVAKVWRDMEMMVVEKQLGEWIGSGYPSDKRTISFMEDWLKRGRILPKPFVRYGWKTTERLLEKYGQPKM